MQQLSKGTLLHGGTYKIEQVLGQGSFGITYLAIHTALSKKIAIKEFFMKELNGRGEDGSITGMSDGSLSMDYARKFQKEALNLSRLDHPNIVRVTDSFADNGTYYYVMDYIEGENLNDYVKHNQISQKEAVDIICDVAKALMYMHEEKHMLHLDLKPGNVMRRSSDGHIFLIDFGLSKHYSSNGQPETSTTIGLGTAGYAPIEQANQAKNGEFRPTIDVYALGATFYKLLTRETPPAASELVSDEDLLLKQLQTHNVNPQLSDFVVHAMCPNVRKRTQTVRDFLSSLPGDITSKSIGTSYTDASTYSSYNEQTRFDNQFAREKTDAESSKESTVERNLNRDKQDESSNSFFNGPLAIIFTILIIFSVIIFCFRGCPTNNKVNNEAVADRVDIDSTFVDPFGVDSTDDVYGDGYHEVKYSDGSTYKGYWVDGQYEGQGTYTEPSTGYTYEGNWHNGQPSGYGIQIWTKEKRKLYFCRYEGNFKNGLRSGKGTAYFVNKTYQKGIFKKGELVRVTEEGTWR